MKFVDTHCHLYENDFKADLHNVLKQSIEAGVTKILIPNIDLSSIASLQQMCATFPQNCFPMLGLHPCYVKADYENVLQLIEPLLNQQKIYGIGEVGLDFYHDITFKQEQINALDIQLNWAKKYDLPVTLHSRNATQELINFIKKKHFGLRGVFHCFSESIEMATQILDLGMFVGIGGVLSFKNVSIAETIKYITLSKIVLETDAPYLAPMPFRGKRNEPAYIKIIAQKLAQILNISEQEVANITTQNAVAIFGFE